jgi:hypothetical protein
MSFQVPFKPIQNMCSSVQVAKSIQAILFTVVAQNVVKSHTKYTFQLCSTAFLGVSLKLEDNQVTCVQVASSCIALLQATHLYVVIPQ